VLRILGITRSFADVLSLFFVHAAVSSPKAPHSVRGPPTSSLVVGKAVKGVSHWPHGLRHWSAAARWLRIEIAFSNPSGDMDGCLSLEGVVCGQVQASVWS